MSFRHSNNMNDFNPDMLALLRQSAGFTQTQLAKESGISQGKLSKLENGLQSPSFEQIDTLSELFSVQPSFFFRSERIPYSPISLYRRRQSLNKSALSQAEADLHLTRMAISRLVRSIEIVADVELPLISVDYEVGRTPAEIARRLRIAFKLPRGPIENLVAALESAGVLIVMMPGLADKIDGVMLADGLDPAMIFLNPAFSWDRLRFTLAHELGHMIMHQIPSDLMEEEANEFAAELLAPEDHIRGHLSGLDLRKLATLKKQWRVSMHFLVYRAKALGMLSSQAERRLWQALGPYRKAEPYEIAAEQPTILRDVIQSHFEHLGYSNEEMAGLLDLSAESSKQWVERFMPTPTSKFRLVVGGNRSV